MTVDELIELLKPYRGLEVEIFSHGGEVPQGWWQANPIDSVQWDDRRLKVQVVAES